MAVARVSMHCRAIRDALSRAVCSVHDRRAKRVPLQVAGGVMLGIDLSRAFDEVPRWALLQSLQHAGATEELQRAVMQLHDSCQYRVKHKGHSGTFSMQKGVRQGCALSPYLYALFSCLIYDTLAERTNPEWAARAHTLFADDTHIAWTTTSVRDLQFVMTCIQHTFQVFRDFGMRVHPEKSQIIVKVRGSAAIRWVRNHQHRTATGWVLDLGSPHAPLRIPRVTQMVYLGVVVSYGSFERQSCAYRIKAATGNKHRLARILHCKRLSLHQRVRLYVACVRSSLLYAPRYCTCPGTPYQGIHRTSARATEG